MNGYIITADIICFLFLCIILRSALSSPRKDRKQSTNAFIILVMVSVIAIIVDASSYFMEEVSTNDSLLRVLNLLSFSLSTVIFDVFSVYMISVIREKTKVSYRALTPVFAASAANIVMNIVGTANEKLFAIIDHKYYAKEWDTFSYVFVLFYMFCLCVILLRYRKKLGYNMILGLGSYMLFPALFSVSVILFGVPEFSYTAASLSIMIIYVTIQGRTISEVMLREEILDEISHTDELSGLKNRRAYDEFILREDRDRIKAVAFFDLNSLKYTNDTYGHIAGDKMIRGFADMLRGHFSEGEIFRISGDEFVVFPFPDSPDDMDNMMDAFRSRIFEKDRIAAMGYVYSDDGKLLHMINEAEKHMYKDKLLYYKETGRERRA